MRDPPLVGITTLLPSGDYGLHCVLQERGLHTAVLSNVAVRDLADVVPQGKHFFIQLY